jgi:hypothetical protein
MIVVKASPLLRSLIQADLTGGGDSHLGPHNPQETLNQEKAKKDEKQMAEKSRQKGRQREEMALVACNN